MTDTAAASASSAAALAGDPLALCRAAIEEVRDFREAAQRAATALAAPGGPVDAGLVEEHQFALHGFAWMATYAAALEQLLAWAERLSEAGRLGELEAAMLACGFGAYLKQLKHGIAMSQDEIARPGDLGLDADGLFASGAARALMAAEGGAARLAVARMLDARGGAFADPGLDETEAMIADQFRRFADDKVAPFAHEWHLADELIPLEIVEEMGALGVFGLTVPEEWGGLGMGKVAMCVVTEELSRGYIGVGSLGTRSEIAAELIRVHGTEAQKEKYLAKIASGEILPTAVFTEPNHGSDLARIRTRAAKGADGDYTVTGNKIWITHAARADLMTLMVRTDPDEAGYRGLSMFLAEKPRGTDADPFPVDGLSGTEIRVLGYRGMKEYELGFDGFRVAGDALLGGKEGEGFKQLMATFESARIQTAARAVGVAQNAAELALRYGQERQQFGKPILEFARVGGKIGWMAVETMMARQLAYFAARQKDSDQRCDIEAGMAKLLAARVAWSNADNAVQVHGGNGYAEEYVISRVLLDARILNIFEGAAEIQAGVIARGLLGRPNR